MNYDVFISERCTDFLLAKVKQDGTRLLYEVRKLGKDPFREPDFSEGDSDGDVCGLIIDEYVLLYRVDHALKRVLVVDITYADQI
ncbi:hypothetical protein [Cerasicoccus fimbriatus]|uniref:hypothetical protein n=1 Tax=Cerasicoccus fimbriatus TaxID=3014554 RepID=UPI0022B3600E|nr:hypothetical protein [Cerasicoccus sp. TK19100]